MKIAELLNTFDKLNVLIPSEKSFAPSDNEVNDIMKLAGIGKATTEPDEHYFPLSSAYPAGDDVHYSKNPADMRSDSVSLYPGYGAKK
jgi:hypothetical protein